MTSSIPSVSVIDDDPDVLNALIRLLKVSGYDASGYSSSEEFLDDDDADKSACVIVDMVMPGLNGLELQRELKSSGRSVQMIFLTGREKVTDTVQAMKEGAVDFLVKPAEAGEVLNAVREAVRRSAENRSREAESREVVRRYQTLTVREKEVFKGLLTGKLNKQIAADLGLVEKTVKVHRGRIMRKMHARTFAQLVRMGSNITDTP